jgi:hypothetical protein
MIFQPLGPVSSLVPDQTEAWARRHHFHSTPSKAHPASRPAATSRFVAAQPNDDPAVAPSNVDWRLCNPKQGKARQEDRDASPPRVGLGSPLSAGPPPSRARTHAASPPLPILPHSVRSSSLPLPRPLRSPPLPSWVAVERWGFHSTPIRTEPRRRFLRLPVRNPILLLRLAARTDSLLLPLLLPLLCLLILCYAAANAGNQFECFLLRSRGFLRFAGTPLS